MSNISPIPPETARAARAIFGSNNYYIILGDRLANILSGYTPPACLGPGWEHRLSIPVLPLLTLFQYMEWLTDRQTMDAFRSRADWKYALHIPMNYHGIPEGVLCQYRQEILFMHSRCMELEALLGRLGADEKLSQIFDPPLEAESLITSVCTLNRSARVLDAMHAALEGLASKHPEWLRQVSSPHWYVRYNPAASSLTPLIPREKPELTAREVGDDAQYLLDRVDQVGTPEINHLEEIRRLRMEIQDQFEISTDRSVRFLPRCGICPSMLTMKGWDISNDKGKNF